MRPRIQQVGFPVAVSVRFTGTLTSVPGISLGNTQTVTVPVAPVVQGDALVAGEDISWVFSGKLPNGVNVSQVRAASATTVEIDFTSSALLLLTTVSVGLRIVAHR